jgi:hypothetical protein
MPNPTTNSGIRDNHKRGIVADFLKANPKPPPDARLAAAASAVGANKSEIKLNRKSSNL